MSTSERARCVASRAKKEWHQCPWILARYGTALDLSKSSIVVVPATANCLPLLMWTAYAVFEIWTLLRLVPFGHRYHRSSLKHLGLQTALRCDLYDPLLHMFTSCHSFHLSNNDRVQICFQVESAINVSWTRRGHELILALWLIA